MNQSRAIRDSLTGVGQTAARRVRIVTQSYFTVMRRVSTYREKVPVDSAISRHPTATYPRMSDSPSALTFTGTTSPSCTSPASSCLASWSPMACCTSRRNGRAP
ncbi:Uncharacterised protein [Mycobacteroides abscessus subsp. abscessus]|nr:Uncharacterised protein [Mycobacteroides abscessus subsp. abscessus]